tara:strand:- start:268 stop:564 length:297 start_codon:yes stop_codon:yes gene_type:complete
MKSSTHISVEYKQQWKSGYLRFAHILKSSCPLARTDSHPDSNDRTPHILIPNLNNLLRHRDKDLWEIIAPVSPDVNSRQRKNERKEQSDSPTHHYANS